MGDVICMLQRPKKAILPQHKSAAERWFPFAQTHALASTAATHCGTQHCNQQCMSMVDLWIHEQSYMMQPSVARHAPMSDHRIRPLQINGLHKLLQSIHIRLLIIFEGSRLHISSCQSPTNGTASQAMARLSLYNAPKHLLRAGAEPCQKPHAQSSRGHSSRVPTKIATSSGLGIDSCWCQCRGVAEQAASSCHLLNSCDTPT